MKRSGVQLSEWLRSALSCLEQNMPRQMIQILFQNFPNGIFQSDPKHQKHIKTICDYIKETKFCKEGSFHREEFAELLRFCLNAIEDGGFPDFKKKLSPMTSSSNLDSEFIKPKLFVGTFSLHGFIRSPKNRLFCFGMNDSFQLGLNDNDEPSDQIFPIIHPDFIDMKVVKVECARYHSVFMVGEGEDMKILFCGPERIEIDQNEKYPSRVYKEREYVKTPRVLDMKKSLSKSETVVDIVCGWHSTFFVLSSGRVLARGFGFDGQLGVGKLKREYCKELKVVKIKVNVKSVSGGEFHSLFLTFDGNVFVTGSNVGFRDNQTWGVGRLGVPSAKLVKEKTHIPVKIEIDRFKGNVKQVGCCGHFSYFLTNEGLVFYCGRVFRDEDPILEPKLLSEELKFVRFRVGFFHAIFESNRKCFFTHGIGGDGQLATGGVTDEKSLKEITPSFSNGKIDQFYCSLNSSYFVDDQFHIFGCGGGEFGQLFDGKCTEVNEKVSNLLFGEEYSKIVEKENHLKKKYFEGDLVVSNGIIESLCAELRGLKESFRKNQVKESAESIRKDWPLIKTFLSVICKGGIFSFVKGSVMTYFGEFSFETNEKCGVGKEYNDSTGKLRYFGEFRNGLRHGNGKLYKKDGLTVKYEGKFINGVFPMRMEWERKKEEVDQLKKTLEKLRSESGITELEQSIQKKLSDEKKKHQGAVDLLGVELEKKLIDERKKHQNTVDQMKNDHKKKLESKINEHGKEVREMKDSCRKEMEELNVNHATLKSEQSKKFKNLEQELSKEKILKTSLEKKLNENLARFREEEENLINEKNGMIENHENFVKQLEAKFKEKFEKAKDTREHLDMVRKKVEEETEKKQFNSLKDLCKKRTNFSDFLVVQRLGRSSTNSFTKFYGANCLTYLCGLNKSESNQVVVMKIVHNYVKDTTGIRKELLENEIVLIPFHPNVVSMVGSFIGKVDYAILPDLPNDVRKNLKPNTAMFLFRYYPKNLKELVRESERKFGVLEYLILIEQMLKGICHLYDHKIVHRDLKPDNVFVDDAGKILIGDFGCSLNCSDFGGKFGHYIGKFAARGYDRGGAPFFLSPEIAKFKGNAEIDYSKNDIFAIGLISYFIAVDPKAADPFKGACAAKRTQKKYVPLKRYPNDIREFVAKMLKVNPDERLSSHEALEECKKLVRGYLLKLSL